MPVGDVVWDVAVGDEGDVDRLVWDGSYLVDHDYTYSPVGELPKYLPALAFPPSYFPFGGEDIAANLQRNETRIVLYRQERIIRTRKIQQEEMDERKKHTCLLVVYHTNSSQPAQIDHYVDTFPCFQLTSLPDLVRYLELNRDSCLDHWDGEWKIVTIKSMIVVEKDQRVVGTSSHLTQPSSHSQRLSGA
ncbi:hypothetical protein K443DRAFT_14528 [Laccaria amethystina LaAM-08-1]|uniref:Uncharacterized protein n=1 Tax=Laccaria amethystina LaAM-08-1 TaxID=1095629 RepID=A0A0C9X410_9AGAR|nr:hypothetical protein K443DRAFT_14528 [Laccaria amethystina LaAM-08-1]